MHEIDERAAATKDCSRCGARAFYWRSAFMAGNPRAASWRSGAAAHRQPAWTCMHCGFIEPHERRSFERTSSQSEQFPP
jgi:ribosomal protein L37E